MSRIDDTFKRLRNNRCPGLVTYVTAGDPDCERSSQILEVLDRSGVDVLEVGVPFSDPLADGEVIQRASERALAAGATLTWTLDLIRNLRSTLIAPVVLFTYANPILRFGLEKFTERAAQSGVDGVLVLDLPIEEAEGLWQATKRVDIDLTFLLSPTTTRERIARAASLGRGFLYGISRLGVTGERTDIADDAKILVERIREVTSLPIALGFGMSSPDHVREVGRLADAAVVGSGLVNVIATGAESSDLPERVSRYVSWLKGEESKV